MMYKIVRYRYHYLTSPQSSGWLTTSPKTFKHIFAHLPARVLNIDVKIFQQVGSYSAADTDYKLVDAWDWLRMYVFPSCDKRMLELAEKNPEQYKLTEHGVWVHRLDLIR